MTTTCVHDECERPARARSLCEKHYRHYRHNKIELPAPLNATIRSCKIESCDGPRFNRTLCYQHHLEMGREAGKKYRAKDKTLAISEKKCYSCLEVKPVSLFSKDTTRPNGLSTSCKDCNSMLRWRHQYGIEVSKIKSMLLEQQERCAICEEVFESRNFYIDHDHSCCSGKTACGKCVRGLLCRNCNWGLGNFKDSISFLNRAAAYIAARS